MKNNFYIIRALTNMHVGSGDASFGVIDNLIQRDPVTNLPTINGSSLKGALKEFFDSKWDKKEVESIFGGEANSGKYLFTSAHLLSIAVKSNKKPYFIATAPMVFEDLKTMGYKISLNLKPNENPIVFDDTEGLIIEDFEQFDKQGNKPQEIINLLGIKNNNLVVFNDNDFKKICDDTHLPVIARNHLENGKSKYLWYEQVVPRESRFWVNIITPDNDENFSNFEQLLTDKNSVIQIGANSTVGYGFTKFMRF